MKKIISVFLVLTLITGMFVGCGSKATSHVDETPTIEKDIGLPHPSEEEKQKSAIDVFGEVPTKELEESEDQTVLITKQEIPQTEESLKKYEDYFFTGPPFTVLVRNFSPEDMSAVTQGQGLDFDFDALYQHLHGTSYSDDYGADRTGDTPIHFKQDVFEETVMSFFNVTVEDLRAGSLYLPEENRYRPCDGVGSPLEFDTYITQVDELEDNMINIHYSLYATNFLVDEDLNTSKAYEGIMTIQLEKDGGYKYIANEVEHF